MVPRGLEPRTLRLLAVRSNQLSYETGANGGSGCFIEQVWTALLWIWVGFMFIQARQSHHVCVRVAPPPPPENPATRSAGIGIIFGRQLKN